MGGSEGRETTHSASRPGPTAIPWLLWVAISQAATRCITTRAQRNLKSSTRSIWATGTTVGESCKKAGPQYLGGSTRTAEEGGGKCVIDFGCSLKGAVRHCYRTFLQTGRAGGRRGASILYSFVFTLDGARLLGNLMSDNILYI